MICVSQGTCLEEAARIEEFFDTARVRVEWLTNRQELAERRFANHGVPWDRAVFKATRQASLHLAVIYMSRCDAALTQLPVVVLAVNVLLASLCPVKVFKQCLPYCC